MWSPRNTVLNRAIQPTAIRMKPWFANQARSHLKIMSKNLMQRGGLHGLGKEVIAADV
jgi:hypothetical protein